MSKPVTDKSSKNKKAFEEPRGTTFLFDPDELVIIGLDTDDGPEHELYDPEVHDPLDENDIKNMDTYGVINPVTITKIDGRPVVVAGRGRTRRAREVKKRQQARGEAHTIRVPCIVRNGDAKRLMGVMVSENEARTAKATRAKIATIHRMIDRSIPEEEIANAFRVDVKTIKNWLVLGSATKVIQDAEAKGQIATSAAIKLAKLPHDEQKAALEAVIAEGGGKGTMTAARRVVGRSKNGNSASTDGVGITSRKAQRKMLDFATGTPDDEPDPYFDGAADALALVLGQAPKDPERAKKLIKAAKAKADKGKAA